MIKKDNLRSVIHPKKYVGGLFFSEAPPYGVERVTFLQGKRSNDQWVYFIQKQSQMIQRLARS